MSEIIELGKTALRGGHLEQAGHYYRQALDTPELEAQGHYGLGLVALKRGELRQAWQEFLYAAPGLEDDPDFHVNFGTVLRFNQRLQDAVEQFEAALRLNEEHPLAWAGLGYCLVDNGDIDKAARYFSKSLEFRPEQTDVQLALGGCLHKLGDIQAALHFYRKALHDQPASDQARLLLGQTLQQCSRQKEAIHFLEPLVDHPQYGLGARFSLAIAYMSEGQAEKVLTMLQDTEAPERMAAQLRAFGARAMNMLGRNEEAVALCRELIEEWPGNAFAWSYLLDMSREPLSERELETLQAEMERAQTAQLRTRFAFALADARERIGDYAGEWEALRIGNAEAAEHQHYDPKRASASVDTYLGLGDREQLEALAAGGDRDYRPIFILGMPRSGTTLIEQVLGSHSEIETAGESGALPFVLEEYIQEQGLEDYQDLFDRMDADTVALLAARFRRTLEQMGITGERVTEKSINNMKLAPVLYAMFPEAGFVVMHRHPLDVTFGCYKRLFNYQSFSFTLEGCAHEYALYYHRTLPFLREHLPATPHELHYEDLVSDQERVTRELLDYVGVPWEEACLEFHRNERQVNTASLNQVRGGLFSRAAGRWERYGSLLDPLRAALRAEGVEPE